MTTVTWAELKADPTILVSLLEGELQVICIAAKDVRHGIPAPNEVQIGTNAYILAYSQLRNFLRELQVRKAQIAQTFRQQVRADISLFVGMPLEHLPDNHPIRQDGVSQLLLQYQAILSLGTSTYSPPSFTQGINLVILNSPAALHGKISYYSKDSPSVHLEYSEKSTVFDYLAGTAVEYGGCAKDDQNNLWIFTTSLKSLLC